MVDWKELERLHALMNSEDIDSDPYMAGLQFKNKLNEAFPAILAERQAMLDKLEAAQRLRDAIRARKALATRIKESGPVPHSDYWGQSIYAADRAVDDALAAFDKEQQ